MTFRYAVLALCAAFAVSGCANNYSGPNASAEDVAKAAYKHDGPPALTLYTMVNNRSGSGAHTSLMVNAPSQRVIFDPAGTVVMTSIPERNDVLFGITPEVERIYASAHARETYHVRIQRLEVSPQVAEKALSLVMRNGKVPAAMCTSSTSQILSQLPGMESISSVMFPNKLADQFAQLPGVTENKRVEYDSDDKDAAVIQMENALRAQQAAGQ